MVSGSNDASDNVSKRVIAGDHTIHDEILRHSKFGER